MFEIALKCDINPILCFCTFCLDKHGRQRRKFLEEFITTYVHRKRLPHRGTGMLTIKVRSTRWEGHRCATWRKPAPSGRAWSFLGGEFISLTFIYEKFVALYATGWSVQLSYMKPCFKHSVSKKTLPKQINCMSNVDFIKPEFPTEIDFRHNCRFFPLVMNKNKAPANHLLKW